MAQHRVTPPEDDRPHEVIPANPEIPPYVKDPKADSEPGTVGGAHVTAPGSTPETGRVDEDPPASDVLRGAVHTRAAAAPPNPSIPAPTGPLAVGVEATHASEIEPGEPADCGHDAFLPVAHATVTVGDTTYAQEACAVCGMARPGLFLHGVG